MNLSELLDRFGTTPCWDAVQRALSKMGKGTEVYVILDPNGNTIGYNSKPEKPFPFSDDEIRKMVEKAKLYGFSVDEYIPDTETYPTLAGVTFFRIK